MKISVVMPTIDRVQGRNFLGQTLESMEAGGVFDSEHLHGFAIVDSGSLDPEKHLERQGVMKYPGIARFTNLPGAPKRHARDNAAMCLRLGANSGADYVLFCEDDIIVCADFLGSVARWMKDHSWPHSGPIYSFGTNYDEIRQSVKLGLKSWRYPTSIFYGTTCMGLYPDTAREVAEYFTENQYLVDGVDQTGKYDLLLSRWAKSKNIHYFLAAVPSFMQHVGDTSTLGNGFIQFPAWGGTDWSYR